MPSGWRACLQVSAAGHQPRLSAGEQTLQLVPSPHGPPGRVVAAAAGTASLSAAAAPRTYKWFTKVSIYYSQFLLRRSFCTDLGPLKGSSSSLGTLSQEG